MVDSSSGQDHGQSVTTHVRVLSEGTLSNSNGTLSGSSPARGEGGGQPRAAKVVDKEAAHNPTHRPNARRIQSTNQVTPYSHPMDLHHIKSHQNILLKPRPTPISAHSSPGDKFIAKSTSHLERKAGNYSSYTVTPTPIHPGTSIIECLKPQPSTLELEP